MAELLTRLLEFIIPPVDAERSKQYGWRVRIAIMTCITFLGLIASIALAFGLVPGFAGFATEATIAQVSEQLMENRTAQIESELLELRIKHCQAKSDEAKQLYWSRISSLMIRYQQLTTRVYALPACSDL